MSETEFSDLINVLNGRAAFYEFFMMAFLKPADDEFLKILKEFMPHFKHMAAEIGDQDLKDGVIEVEEFVNKMDLTEDLLTNLNRSYTSLFLLGGSSIPTAESVYLSPAKLMKQEPWEEVLKIYYDNQFGVPKEMKQTEEHISSELLFMFALSRRAADALAENDEDNAEQLIRAQNEFLNRHILRWIPDMCDLIINTKFDHIILYKGVAKLLKGYLSYDKEFLQEVSAGE